MAAKNVVSSTDTWHALRQSYLHQLLSGLFVCGWIALPLFFTLLPTTGLLAAHVVCLINFAVIVIAFGLRKRLPERVIDRVVVYSMILFSVIGIVTFGLFGSLAIFTITTMVILVLYSWRLSLIYSVFFLSCMSLIAVGYIGNYLQLPVGPDILLTSPSLWATQIAATAILIFFILYAMHNVQSGLRAMITQIEAQNKTIQYLADHDTLTGLATARLANERLDLSIAIARRSEHLVAVLFLDLDGFKSINDNHGHSAGDALLKELAKRFRQAVRPGDTVCRIGGDEFLVILAELHRTKEAADTCQRLIAVTQKPLAFGTALLQVGVSIGVAFFPYHGNKGEKLRTRADQAMYQAKHAGKNGYHMAAISSQ